MTQFKVGDEVFVKGTVQRTDSVGIEVYIDQFGARWIDPSDLHPLPSPPAAVEQPTAPEVTQATAVFAGMQRERLWADWAGQAINALIHKAPLLDAEGEHGPAFDKATLTQFRSDMAVSAFDYADAMLAEFDRRGKGGE